MNPLPEVASSKSILNRVLLLCSYLQEPIVLYNYIPNADSATFLENLKLLGFDFKKREQQLTVFPPQKINKAASLFIKDAGTAYRFLLARLCFIPGGRYKLKISRQLQKRPIEELITALQNLGAQIEQLSDSIFYIQGTTIKKNKVEVDGNRSSQFVSALYLLAPLAQKRFEVSVRTKLVSSSYVNLTKQILADFGIQFSKGICKNNVVVNPKIYNLEPDYSAMSYFWLLASMNDFPIYTFYQNSWQPDSKFWQILRKMGAKTEVLPSKLKMQYRTLQSIQVDMQNMPDQVPTLAVAALFAKGKTIISQIQHLRYKESDRIGNLITELKKLGAEINYKNNKLIITPLSEKPPTTVLNAHNDHRLFMSFYIISKLWPQIEVQNANCVKKSFPNFLKEVEKITNYLAFTQIKKDLFH